MSSTKSTEKETGEKIQENTFSFCKTSVILKWVFFVFFRDDQIILNATLFYIFNKVLPGGSHFPLWRTDGIILTALIHAGPVEFLYYWLHRALHHHYLYNRYHSHHHSSIATEPISCTQNVLKLFYKMLLWSLSEIEWFFLLMIFGFCGSCDSSVRWAHCLLCFIFDTTSDHGVHRNSLHSSLWFLHYLHWLDEQHGTLQLWVHP